MCDCSKFLASRGKVNPAREVKFKRGVVAKGAVGLVFEPQNVGERVEPLGEPCHWVILSLRDETHLWVLEPLLLIRGPPPKGQPW